MSKKLYEIENYKKKKLRCLGGDDWEYFMFDSINQTWIDQWGHPKGEIVSTTFDWDIWEEYSDEHLFTKKLDKMIEFFGINRIKSAVDQKLKEMEQY